jgi:hypothetical protein
VGAGQGVGDREIGELETEGDAEELEEILDGEEAEPEVGETALEAGVDVVYGSWTECFGKVNEDGKTVQEGRNSGLDTEEEEENGKIDSWNTTSREI